MALEQTAEEAKTGAPSFWDALARALSPIEYRPKIVANLEAAHFTTRSGQPYVVVNSPAAGTYLKLDPDEFELLALMDGTRTVKALVVEYYQRHKVLVLPKVAGLVRLLRSYNFLTDPPLNAYESLGARLRGRDAGSLLLRLARGFVQSSISLPRADAVLGSWYSTWGRLFFTRPAVLLGLVLAIAGPVLLMLELARGRYDPFRTGGSFLTAFILLAVLQVVSLFIHELGHGLAVKHARRQARHAGVMIYYGAPAGYVDTTDVWMAPPRMRLLTSLAGPWTGLVLGGIFSLAAFVLPDGPAGAFLFAWAFLFLIGNLMNFNPLLELDGYYLLVDLLEKPMLRARALSFVRGPLWSKLKRRNTLTGGEKFFALFGLASAAWTVASLMIAVQFWRMRLLPLVQEAWDGGGIVARVILLLLGALVVTPILLSLWGLVRKLRGKVMLRIRWLRNGAVARRNGEAMAALRSVPLWANLPGERLLEVARTMIAREVPAGTDVVRQGEPGDEFYIVARGALEVLVDGRPVTHLSAGDYFGERALLYDVPRAATVTAMEPSLVFSVGRGVFHASLAHDLATRARLDAALDYRSEIAAMPLLRSLSPSEIDLLLTRLVPVSAAQGDDIIRQGEPGDRFYIVRSGQVEVMRDGQVLDRLGPGDSFGEIALLFDIPRTATVRATEPAELLALAAEDFRDLLAGYCGRSGELERLSHLRMATHRPKRNTLAA